MNTNDLTRLSKFLSLVLRHDPARIGLTLDPNGWVGVDDLIHGINTAGKHIDRRILERIVAEDAKQRYTFSDDGERIRASQGHSIAVDLELAPVAPPEILYHGTADRFLPSILEEGLLPRSRQHVHLSGDEETAITVGRRHGRVVVLRISAGAMAADGHRFYLSENGVWLTDRVPAEYLDAPSSSHNEK